MLDGNGKASFGTQEIKCGMGRTGRERDSDTGQERIEEEEKLLVSVAVQGAASFLSASWKAFKGCAFH